MAGYLLIPAFNGNVKILRQCLLKWQQTPHNERTRTESSITFSFSPSRILPVSNVTRSRVFIGGGGIPLCSASLTKQSGNLWKVKAHMSVFMWVSTCVWSLMPVCNSNCKFAVLWKIQASRLLPRYVSVVLRWYPKICILSNLPKWVTWSNIFRKLISESRSNTN